MHVGYLSACDCHAALAMTKFILPIPVPLIPFVPHKNGMGKMGQVGQMPIGLFYLHQYIYY